MRRFLQFFSKGDLAFYTVVGVVFYLFVRQYTMIVEDVCYALIHPENKYRVESIVDAMTSQLWDYLHVNGRYIVHTLVSWFCSTNYWARELMFVVSALMFVLLNMGVGIILRVQIGNHRITKYVILLLLLMFIPDFGRTYIGHAAYQVNYLWSSALFVWFYIFWRYFSIHNAEKRPLMVNILLSLAMLVYGSWQESFTLSVCTFLFFYYVCHFREIKGTMAWLLFGYAVGACIGIFAPSNFARANGYGGAEVLTGMEKYTFALSNIASLWAVRAVVLCFLLLLVTKRAIVKDFIHGNAFWLTCMAVNLLFALVVFCSGVHQFVLSGIVATVLVVKFLCNMVPSQVMKYSGAIRGVIAASILLFCIPVYGYRQRMVSAWDIFIENCKHSNDGTAVGKEMYLLNKELTTQNPATTYTNIYFLRTHLYKDEWYWKLISNILTDGRDSLFITTNLPETKEHIVNACRKNGQNALTFLPECQLYVLRVDTTKEWKHSTFSIKIHHSWLGKRKNDLLNVFSLGQDFNACSVQNIPKWPQSFVSGDSRYVIIDVQPTFYDEFKLNEIK